MSEQAWFACYLCCPVVSAYPSPKVSALVPTGVVPDDDHHSFAFRSCSCQQADDEQPRLPAVGLSIAEIQQYLLRVMPHRTKTRQSFVGLTAFGFALHQPQFLTCFSPGMGLRLSKARKPAFIFLHQQPFIPLVRLLFQPVAPLFFTV